MGIPARGSAGHGYWIYEYSCFIKFINELGKRDKLGGLPSILSLFHNEFNQLNDTRASILDSIYT